MKTYKTNWYEFTPTWSGFNLIYELSGYDDTRPVLQIYLIWGKLFLYLPWKHYKKIERQKTIQEIRNDKLLKLKNPKYKIKKVYKKVNYDGIEPPSYGIYLFMNQLGIRYGDKIKLYDVPWAWEWVRTSYLGINNEWIHETKKTKGLDFWDDKKWKDKLFVESYPYKYVTKNNEEQNCIATITVEEREWRWKIFKWLKYPNKIRKDIKIKFSDEIGESKGTYKGGVIGTSYQMLPNETPYETLKRMEKDKIFS